MESSRINDEPRMNELVFCQQGLPTPRPVDIAEDVKVVIDDGGLFGDYFPCWPGEQFLKFRWEEIRDCLGEVFEGG